VNLGETVNTLRAACSRRGWAVEVIPTARVAEARSTIEAARNDGLLDQGFYAQYLEGAFSWVAPEGLPDAASVIVIVIPAPPYRLTFVSGGREREVLIPPTYVGYRPNADVVRTDIAEIIAPHGYRVVTTRLPEKTLAVLSGLAQYGRNNITYTSGPGSFAQIVTAWSDLPAPEDPSRPAALLDRCATCTACIRACPTGAIPETGAGRFMLRAERCLTYFNEQEGDFPAWVDRGAHNALVGCLRCQAVCPGNRGVAGLVEKGPVFTEEETDLLLAAAARDRLPPETLAKIDGLQTSLTHERFCRNLAVLLAQPVPDPAPL
jgi:epoxyqueuosine reductase